MLILLYIVIYRCVVIVIYNYNLYLQKTNTKNAEEK